MFSFNLPCGDFQTLTTLTKSTITFEPPVYEQRYCAAIQILEDSRWSAQIKKVVEFGCAEMRFFQLLRRIETIENITMVDIDEEILMKNVTCINPLVADYIRHRLGPLHVEILKGSVADASEQLLNTDAVIALELIEHVYDDVLNQIPSNIFGLMQPKVAVFSTPNADFNVIFKPFNTLLPNGFRHDDHKFEWTREQFKSWCLGVVEEYPNYMFSIIGVGKPPKGFSDVGHVSQIAIFVRKDFLDMELVEPLNSSPTFESKEPYKLLYSVDYPFSVDTRTVKEKIWSEVEFEINRFKRAQDISENDTEYDQVSGYKIPIADLLTRIQHEDASKDVLMELFQEKSLEVNDDCVIIPESDEESNDSDPGDLCDHLSQEARFSDQESEEECWDAKEDS
ncbi:small RNA 2'-O-methyltransferase [Drosophila bipectinata]|uniref:small RNA 2'-O-methyltransferase n=1 Tax=Drosophila bipectinata TaxID=42026 RepID=UPI001C89E239|nr:small RNA 2'-O-methyltransferase [Drosophila bipectinata]